MVTIYQVRLVNNATLPLIPSITLARRVQREVHITNVPLALDITCIADNASARVLLDIIYQVLLVSNAIIPLVPPITLVRRARLEMHTTSALLAQAITCTADNA